MIGRICFILALITCGIKGYAQENVFFVPDPVEARWSYQETDANGRHVADVFYSVDTMNGDAVNGKVRLKVEKVMSASPSDTLKSVIFYRFKDGECMVDMNALFEEDVLTGIMKDAIGSGQADASESEMNKALEEVKKQFRISGEIRGIPQYPQTGTLPDYEFQFKFSIVSMKISGEQRKITGKEQLTTPAGVFDCFIMEETITTKAMMQKDVEKTVSWYAYGIGLVKEMTYDKKGRLTSVTTLNRKNW